MTPHAPTLVEIDRAMSAAADGGQFEIELERRYEGEVGAARSRRMATAALWFAVVWALVPLVDSRMVGDVLPLSIFLNLCVVVPAGLATAHLTARGCGPALREGLASMLVVVAVAAVLTVHAASASPLAVHHHWLASLPILYGNVVLRPRLLPATIASSTALVLYGSAMVMGDLPAPVAVMATIDMTVTVALTLVAGFLMERELRRAWLSKLRSELTAHRLTHRNDELRQLSHVDTLTGLANRRALDLRLVEVAGWSRTRGEPIAALMIDVDHFKQFNDRYGHKEGDRCLIAVARAACEQVRRKEDLIGRFGGEEFLVLLPGADLTVAARVAERIRRSVETLEIAHAGGVAGGVVTVSIGCMSGVVDDDWTIDHILESADSALYAAKRRGRNRVCPPPLERSEFDLDGAARDECAAAAA
ncbi:MAG: diguanylate cyclase [Siculibacillus sp.]